MSVLTPSFNQARWLQDTIDSVQAQDYPRIEHIVMDGGSDDGSVEILRRASGCLRFESERDQGQSHALNKAFRSSSGEIIGWLNSDDAYFSRSAVERAVLEFERYPEAAVVYGHAALVDAGGRLLSVLWTPPHSYSLLRKHNYIVQPAAFVRRSVLGDHLVDEGFDYMMDRELWLRLGAEHPFGRIGHVLAIDRHHAGRKSYTRPDLAALDLGRLRERYGVSTGRRTRAVRKARKAGFRVRGLKDLTDARRSSPALPLLRPSIYALMVNQLLLPRAVMAAASS